MEINLCVTLNTNKPRVRAQKRAKKWQNNVFAIEPIGLDGAQEELRAVGVGSGIGHGKDS